MVSDGRSKSRLSKTKSYNPGPWEADWWKNAACQGVDPELFFPEVGPGDQKKLYHDIAQTIATYCEKCPVRVACAKYALENRERLGIWGGAWLGNQIESPTTTFREGVRGLKQVVRLGEEGAA